MEKTTKYPKCKAKMTHHWMLDEPNGKYSTGVCKNCGKVLKNYFQNSFDYSNWYHSTQPKHSKKPRQTVSRWDKKSINSKKHLAKLS